MRNIKELRRQFPKCPNSDETGNNKGQHGRNMIVKW